MHRIFIVETHRIIFKYTINIIMYVYSYIDYCIHIDEYELYIIIQTLYTYKYLAKMYHNCV